MNCEQNNILDNIEKFVVKIPLKGNYQNFEDVKKDWKGFLISKFLLENFYLTFEAKNIPLKNKLKFLDLYVL